MARAPRAVVAAVGAEASQHGQRKKDKQYDDQQQLHGDDPFRLG